MDIIPCVWGLVGIANNGGNSRTQREMPKIKHCEEKNAVSGFIKRTDLGAREMPQVGESLYLPYKYKDWMGPQLPHPS